MKAALGAVAGVFCWTSCSFATVPVSWINVKDPTFGAVGNGVADDTAAIQAAIDYAFTTGVSAVYCPKGTYKTSDSLWLDPPGNLRATTFTGTGYIAGTTFTVSTGSTSGLFVGSHIYGTGVLPNTVIISGTSSPYTVNSSQTAGSSGSPIALTGNNPHGGGSVSGFSFSFFGDPSDNQAYPSCRIAPTFNNGHAIEVGLGAGMRVSNISVAGTGVAQQQYRGDQPSYGVALALNGGNQGSSPALIQDVTLSNYYTCTSTDTNKFGSLSDTNTFERLSCSNAYNGIVIQGANALVNHAIDVRFIGVNVGFDTTNGAPLVVSSGTVQPETAQYNSYTLGSVSALVGLGTDPGTGGPFTFTAILSAPTVTSSEDPTGFGFAGNSSVYAWWGLQTTDFGVVPLTVTAWNSSTKQATFQIYVPWELAEFGTTDLATTTNLSAEIQATTTGYATERVYLARGSGITIDGTTTEAEGTCETLIDKVGGLLPGQTTVVRNVLNLSNPYTFSAGNTAYKYCQRTMPLVQNENANELILDGGDWAPPAGGNSATNRVLVETSYNVSGITAHNLGDFHAIYRYGAADGGAWGQNNPNPAFTWEAEARGVGKWDKDYTVPSLTFNQAAFERTESDLRAPFCGVEACPNATMDLTAQLLNQVCPGGNISACTSLGIFSSYPPIACREVFRSTDWNTGSVPPSTAPAHLYLRTNSCPGYSWGQNITDTSLHAYQTAFGFTLTSVSWRHLGQSPVLYLDATTLGLMFPGLGFYLDSGDGSGSVPYIVTGVYEDLPDPLAPTVRTGFVTAIRSSAATGGLLAGVATTSYVCTSSCTITQQPFAFTAY